MTVALLLAASALPAAPAVAAETITVEGNRRVEADTVRSYFHAWPGGHLDAAALDAALKSLIATGLFDKVTIDRAGDKIIVHMTEAKLLDRVAFEGNKKIKDTELAAVVQSKARGPLQRALVQADDVVVEVNFGGDMATDVPGGTTSAWCPKSSTAAATVSTSSSPSPKARKPRCGKSTSSAIRCLADASSPP